MPLYVWKCLNCGEKMEVTRPIDKSDVGPPNCKKCRHTSFEKIITPVAITGRLQKGYYNNQKKGVPK